MMDFTRGWQLVVPSPMGYSSWEALEETANETRR